MSWIYPIIVQKASYTTNQIWIQSFDLLDRLPSPRLRSPVYPIKIMLQLRLLFKICAPDVFIDFEPMRQVELAQTVTETSTKGKFPMLLMMWKLQEYKQMIGKQEVK